MRNNVPYINETGTPQLIGSVTVMPWQCLDVDATALAAFQQRGQAATAAAPQPEKPDIEALQKLSVAKIEPHIEKLTDAELTELADKERASPTPRSTLLSAIDFEVLTRTAAE